MGWAETIDNYQLKFDVWSRSNGCAAADLVCGGDFPAQGVLYEVPDNLMSRDSAPAGRRSFDAIEGDAYVRRSIAVKRRDGTIVEAQTYVVLTPQTGLLTSADYVAHIIEASVNTVPIMLISIDEETQLYEIIQLLLNRFNNYDGPIEIQSETRMMSLSMLKNVG